MIETDFPTKEQLDAFVSFLENLVFIAPRIILTIVLIVVGVFLFFKAIVLAFRLISFVRLMNRDLAFLELTPKAFSNKTLLASSNFFSDLHGLEEVRSIRDKLSMHGAVFSVEMVGTRENGVRFIISVDKKGKDSFKRDVSSFGSEIKVNEIKDYLTDSNMLDARLMEFSLREKYYPLKGQDKLEQDDPVEHLLSAMKNLEKGEIVAIQLLLSPARVRKAKEISNKLLYNREHLNSVGKQHRRSFIGIFGNVLSSVLFSITDSVGDVYHGPSSYERQSERTMSSHYKQVSAGIRPERQMSSLELDLARQVRDKLDSQLFRANIRAIAVTNDANEAKMKLNDIRKSFSVYRTNYQEIISRGNLFYRLLGWYRSFLFKNRLPGVFNVSLLDTKELASIYHFPNDESNYNNEIIKSLSKTLPATVEIRKNADQDNFDVILGRNYHNGEVIDIGLTKEERERHLYLIGSTGGGKSTMMKYAIIQDMKAGKGLAVVDPHGDLAVDVLRHVPEERKKDVVYFNPADLSRAIGFNPLEMPKGLDEDQRLLEQNRIVDAVVSIFRKVFSDDENGGHRLEDILRNSVETAMTVENATLFTALKILRNGKYRKRIVSALEDGHLKDFWREEIGLAGTMQRVNISRGVTHKINRFRASPSARRVLEQPKSTINFDDIINSGKILICNFSEEIGEDTSALFGALVLAELKMAAQRRSNIEPSKRRPFYLYVDEFQYFATKPFVKMLSSLRKYKMFLIIAEQSTFQQENQRMVEAILTNVKTVVAFGVGSSKDEEILLKRFAPFLDEGDIMNLPAYSFYARLSAVVPQAPVSGMTIMVDEGSEKIVKDVIKISRNTYGRESVREPNHINTDTDKGKQKNASLEIKKENTKYPN